MKGCHHASQELCLIYFYFLKINPFFIFLLPFPYFLPSLSFPPLSLLSQSQHTIRSPYPSSYWLLSPNVRHHRPLARDSQLLAWVPSSHSVLTCPQLFPTLQSDTFTIQIPSHCFYALNPPRVLHTSNVKSKYVQSHWACVYSALLSASPLSCMTLLHKELQTAP